MKMAICWGVSFSLGMLCCFQAAALSREDEICAQASSASAQVKLTNAGLIDQTKVDNARTEIKLLASQTLVDGLIQKVFHIVLHESGGRQLTFILGTRYGADECPYDAVDIWVVARDLPLPASTGIGNRGSPSS